MLDHVDAEHALVCELVDRPVADEPERHESETEAPDLVTA